MGSIVLSLEKLGAGGNEYVSALFPQFSNQDGILCIGFTISSEYILTPGGGPGDPICDIITFITYVMFSDKGTLE